MCTLSDAYTELDSICEKINGIWYYKDKNISDFNANVGFDENHAKNFGEYSLEYLRGISPKYNTYSGAYPFTFRQLIRV